MPKPSLGRLLIVDDEIELAAALSEMLTLQGYEAVTADSAPPALEALQAQDFDVLLTDLRMPEMDGITLLQAGLALDPNLVGVIMTGHGAVSTAVEAMKVGAFDFILKPFKLKAVLPVLSRAMDVRRLRLDNVQLHEGMAVYELSQTIGFTLDSNTILHQTADAALQQCRADEISILLPTPEGNELYVAVVRGPNRGHLLGTRVPFDRGVAGWAARHRRTLTLRGEIRDARFAPAHPRPDIFYSICLPMITGDRLVGVMCANITSRRRSLTPGQLKGLAILTGAAAPALAAARLHEQVRRSEEQHRLVVDNVDEIIYQVDMPDDPFRGAVRFVSRRAEDITGYAPEEFIADNRLWFHSVHPDDIPALQSQSAAIYESGRSGAREFRMRHKVTGEYRWIEDRVVPRLDESGRLASLFGVARDITERKRAEDKLRFQADILTSVHDSIIVTDLEGKIVYWNEGASAIFNYSAEEMLGHTPAILYPDLNPEQLATDLKNIMEGQDYVGEWKGRRKDGATVWVDIKTTLMRDAAGRATGFIGVAKDITERKQAEEALRRSEAQLRALVSSMDDIAFEFDADGVYLNVWTRNEGLLARPRDEMIGRRTTDVMGGELGRTLMEAMRRAIAGRQAESIEYLLEVQDGARWFQARINPILQPDGSCQTASALVRDITGQKRTEIALRRSEERFSKAFHANPSSIAITRLADGLIVDANDAFLRMFGYADGAEVVGHTSLELNMWTTPDERSAMVRRLREQGVLREFEAGFRRKSGEIGVMLASTERIELGGEECILSMFLDITERKRAEEAVAASERRFRALIENSADAITLLDANGAVAYDSPASPGMLGYEPEEWIGRNAFEAIHPDDLPSTLAVFKSVLEGPRRKASRLFRYRHKNGSWRWLDAVASNLLDEPAVQAVVVNYRDITERRRAEAEANLLRSTALAIALAPDFNSALDAALQTICEAAGWSYGETWMPRPDNSALEPGPIWYGREAKLAKFRESSEEYTFRPGEGLPGRVWASKEPEWIPDVSVDGEVFLRAPAALEAGIRAGLGIPIIANGEVLVVVFFMFEAREEDRRFTEIAMAASAQLGTMLLRKRAEAENKRRTEDLELIHALNSAVNRGDSLPAMVELLRAETARVFASRGATVYLLSEDRQHLLAPVVNLPPDTVKRVEEFIEMKLPELRIPLREGSIYRDVLLEGKPRLISDPQIIQSLMAEFTDNPLLKKMAPKIRALLGIRSVIGVPLIAGGGAIGLLEIGSKEPFTEADLRRLTVIGGEVTAIVQRKQAEESLRQSEALFSQVFHASPIPISLTTLAGGRILDVNEAGVRLYGYEREEMIGRTVFDLQVWVDSEEQVEIVRRLRAGQPVRGLEIGLRTRAGQIRSALISADVIQWGGEACLLALSHDITERKQMETAIRESEERYRALIENSVEAIYLCDPITWRLQEANPAFLRLLGWTPEEVSGLTVYDFVAHDRVSIESFMNRIQAQGATTIGERKWRRKDGSPVDLYVTGSKIRQGDRETVFVIAHDITERKQREREMEAVVAVSAAMRAATTRAEMLPVILDQLLEMLKARGAALALRDPQTGEAVIHLARGAWSSWTNIRLQPGEGVTGHVILTGQPYVSPNVEGDPRMTHLELLGGLRAVACAPLAAHGQTIGALWIGRAEAIAPDESRIFTAIADMAASAIHRAALHEQTERNLQRLTALRTIDATITGSLDVRLTLKVLLEQIAMQLQVDAAAVLLLDTYTQTLEYAAGRGFRTGGIARSSVRLGEGHAGRAALEHKVVCIPDLPAAGSDFVRARLLADEDFVSYTAAPLVAKGQVKGVLEIFHRAPLTPDPEWLDFLETVAGQAAIAVEDAQLFEGLQRSHTELALAYDATIEGWSRALDLRDRETEGHTRRVTEMTIRLARAMGIKEDEMVHVRRGALLHDIGKMGIPDSILLKPGPLTAEEWVIMRRHPDHALSMLAPIAYLRPALDIPYCHHEKWDGSGYPRGLRGDGIPPAARIFTVVDVWDALLSDRPYRKAWTQERVGEYLRSQSGAGFDPKVVEAFMQMLGGE